MQIALDYDLPVLIHTPHLEDKLKGTKLIIDSLASFSKLDRSKVIIDHVEEHTAGMVLDAGFWAGMTLYPESKCTPNRAIDILEIHGTERIWMNSACDWGVSDPMAVPKCALEMRRRKYTESQIAKIVYDNPLEFLRQSPRFDL